MKIHDRVYFHERVAISAARHIRTPVVLSGRVAAVYADIVAVKLPGGRLHHVPRGRCCAREGDAVALMHAAEGGVDAAEAMPATARRKVA